MEFKDNTLYFSEPDRGLCKGLPADAPVDDVDIYRSRIQAQTEAVEAALLEAQGSPFRGDNGIAERLGARLSALNVLGNELAEAAHQLPGDASEVELQKIIFRG